MWIMRGWFVVLGLATLFIHLLPLSAISRPWATPDLMLGFAFAWSARKPVYVPVILIGLMLLLSDLLLQRPPGLWAFLGLLCCENLQNRAKPLRASNFATEWSIVTSLLFSTTILYHIILAIFLVEQPNLGSQLIQTITTILYYPVIVFATHVLMGVRKGAPGDTDARGGHI
jgi:rod shape-determining protein MreD